METEKMKKNDKIFNCIICEFNTCKKTNYNIHLRTQKHKINDLETFGNILETEKILKCENCNKIYNNRTGLWKHKKKCIIINYTTNDTNNTNVTEPSDKELIILLLQQNAQLIQHNSELVKNGINNNKNSKNY
jgi:hypothetical protein